MSNGVGAGAPVMFLNRSYEEAVGLLVEARNYLATEEPHDRAHMPPMDRLLLSLETTRMTTALTHVIAWLLTRKAIHAGEISQADAATPEYRLGGHRICLDDAGAHDQRMPERLRDLLSRTHRLYVRVSRLDELASRASG